MKYFFGLALALLAVSAQASVWYVKADAGGANTGTSWTDAYTDLQSAITASTGGDEIWVAAGTYKPSIARLARLAPRSNSFSLKAGVALYGGFVGTEDYKEERGGGVSILSGDLGVADDSSDNAYCVVVCSVGSVTLNGVVYRPVLDGFTIRDGNADAGFNNYSQGTSGGGLNVFSNSSTLAVTHCEFTHNHSLGSGAGAYIISRFVNLDECSFTYNAASSGASASGGGLALFITNPNTSPAVDVAYTNLSFSFNSGENGGAVRVSGGSNPVNCNFDNCTFTGNTAVTLGGALYADALKTTIILHWTNFEGNTVVNNTTNSGGALSVVSLTAEDCQFLNNSVGGTGGACYLYGALSVQRCYFYGNQALPSQAYSIGKAGAIYYRLLSGQSGVIANSVFSANSAASDGGAVVVYKGNGTSSDSLTITNCSFRDNAVTNPMNGPGYVIAGDGDYTPVHVNIYNSIITAPVPNDTIRGDFNNTVRYCILQPDLPVNWMGTKSDVLYIDPLFDVAPSYLDLNLEGDSPARDSGSATYQNGSYDILGRPRSSGNGLDMGAYEIQ